MSSPAHPVVEDLLAEARRRSRDACYIERKYDGWLGRESDGTLICDTYSETEVECAQKVLAWAIRIEAMDDEEPAAPPSLASVLAYAMVHTALAAQAFRAIQRQPAEVVGDLVIRRRPFGGIPGPTIPVTDEARAAYAVQLLRPWCAEIVDDPSSATLVVTCERGHRLSWTRGPQGLPDACPSCDHPVEGEIRSGPGPLFCEVVVCPRCQGTGNLAISGPCPRCGQRGEVRK